MPSDSHKKSSSAQYYVYAIELRNAEVTAEPIISESRSMSEDITGACFYLGKGSPASNARIKQHRAKITTRNTTCCHFDVHAKTGHHKGHHNITRMTQGIVFVRKYAKRLD